MRYIPLLLLLVLLFGPVVAAQDATPPSPEDLDAQIQTLEAMATQVTQQLDDLHELAGQASNDVNHAFNLLGLLEAFGFVVSIVGGAAAVVGVTRFVSAQQDLQEARERFEDEIEKSSKRLEEENEQRETQFTMLRESLERSTGDATLALSFLPLGESQYKSGDFSGALDVYHRALDLDPDNPIINYRLGYVYTHSGRLEEAERYLQQALEIEPDFAPALATLGYVYRRRSEKMEQGIDRADDPQPGRTASGARPQALAQAGR